MLLTNAPHVAMTHHSREVESLLDEIVREAQTCRAECEIRHCRTLSARRRAA